MQVKENKTAVRMAVNDTTTETPMTVTEKESQEIMVISGDTDIISFDIKTAPPVGEIYSGTYLITPLVNAAQELPTAHKILEQNVVVEEIPYYEVSNQYGKTVHIGD